MKIIFAGTPHFALSSLEGLFNAGSNLVAVYTQPDRPAGRGHALTMTPVKAWALEHGLPIYTPQTLKTEEAQAIFKSLEPDLMIVVAYGLILPKNILEIPKLGCINVHASLLPRWRGASPIQHAVLSGDLQTGISLMQMDPGLDAGPILKSAVCPIGPADTASSLHDKLAVLGSHVLCESLEDLRTQRLTPTPQDLKFVTYAPKITKEMALMNWREEACVIERKIRAFFPSPIAYTYLNGQYLRVLQAELLDFNTQALPGTIIAVSHRGCDVATGSGILRILKLQEAGSKALSFDAFFHARGALFNEGAQFQCR